MTRRISSFLAIATVVAAAGTCLAQQNQPGAGGGGGGQQPAGGGGAGGRREGGQPGGPGGPAGQGGGQGFIDRLMQADTNGDGMLQWDEVPEQNRERLFERGDTNKDKVLDKAELTVMAQQRGPGRQGPGGPAMSMHDGMEQANRAMRTLKRSQFDAASKTQDLAAVQALQSGLVAAKGDLANAKLSDVAKAKYKDDTASYQKDLRKMLIDTAMEALKLELAINAGDSAAAAKSRDALEAMEEAGHKQFQPEEEERPAGGGGRGPGGSGGGQPGGGRPPR